MNLPGFSAELSLYTGGQYRAKGSDNALARTSGIEPQLSRDNWRSADLPARIVITMACTAGPATFVAGS